MALTNRFQSVQPWISLAVRLVAGALMLYAGWAKVVDLEGSVRAVRAYQLLPEAIVPLFGYMLPFVEILVGVLIIIGLFTRPTAVFYCLMIVGFLIGLAWVWIKGYNIDCGCFGGGGEVAEGETNYFINLLERLGFMALGLWLVFFPRSRFSVDSWVRGGA